MTCFINAFGSVWVSKRFFSNNTSLENTTSQKEGIQLTKSYGSFRCVGERGVMVITTGAVV